MIISKELWCQTALEEEQVLCDQDGHQVPVERAQRLECTSDFQLLNGNRPGVPLCWSSPTPVPQCCTHWWNECESSTSWPSGARGLENGSSGGQERERAQTLPARPHSPPSRGPAQKPRREQCPPAAPRRIPARCHPGRPHQGAQDTGVLVLLRDLPPPKPRGSVASWGCLRASPRVSRPPHPGTAPASPPRPETPDSPTPGAHPLSIPALRVSPTAPPRSSSPLGYRGSPAPEVSSRGSAGCGRTPSPRRAVPRTGPGVPGGPPAPPVQVGPTPPPSHRAAAAPPRATRQPSRGPSVPAAGVSGGAPWPRVPVSRVPCAVSPVPKLTVAVRHRCTPSSAARPFRSALPSQRTPRRPLPLAGAGTASDPIGERGHGGRSHWRRRRGPAPAVLWGREDGGGRCEEHRGRAGPRAEGAPHPPVPALRRQPRRQVSAGMGRDGAGWAPRGERDTPGVTHGDPPLLLPSAGNSSSSTM